MRIRRQSDRGISVSALGLGKIVLAPDREVAAHLEIRAELAAAALPAGAGVAPPSAAQFSPELPASPVRLALSSLYCRAEAMF